MKTRCSTCRGRGHVGGWSRVCGDCAGQGFIEHDSIAPTPDHGTLERYDDLGCRCGPCVKVATRTAADTALGRELGLTEPLPDRPDDQDLPLWMVSMHENCGNGPSVVRTSDGMYRAKWPCGIQSDHVNVPLHNLNDPGWVTFHDLAIADAEHRRNVLDQTAPAKGVQVR